MTRDDLDALHLARRYMLARARDLRAEKDRLVDKARRQGRPPAASADVVNLETEVDRAMYVFARLLQVQP